MQITSKAIMRRAGMPAWTAPAAAFCLFAAVLLQGCKQDKEKSTVLAQVGTSTLTLAELRESFPVEFEQLIRREQYLDFIKRWIDDEVIYQQAQKAHLEKDSTVARKLAKVRRKLLIEEFLARENASEMSEPDEMAMNQYYEMHKEDFRRKVPEVKFAHIRVQTSRQASELRGKINRGDFLAVAAANSLDPAPESYASIAFKKQNEFPSCLAQEIAGAGVGAVTLPIACPDGFYLVKVLERQDIGSLISFAEAKEEISGILVMDRRDKLQESRIAKYKEGMAIGYNLDQVPGQADTSKAVDAPAFRPSEAKAASSNTSGTVPAAVPSPKAKPQSVAASHAQTAPAAQAAADPAAQAAGRLPRELRQDKPGADAATAPPAPARVKAAHKRARPVPAPRPSADSGDVKTSGPGAKAPMDPGAGSSPQSSAGAKPETEENSNGQKSDENP